MLNSSAFEYTLKAMDTDGMQKKKYAWALSEGYIYKVL